jgi:uncharacterized membrane protein
MRTGVILKSLFMPFFLGTSFASLALASIAVFRCREPGALAMLSGGVLYVVGMFVVTMMFNVPLNNALKPFGSADRNAPGADGGSRKRLQAARQHGLADFSHGRPRFSGSAS